MAAKIVGVPIIVHSPHGHIFYGYYGKFMSRVFVWIERIFALFTDRIFTLTSIGKREHVMSVLEIGLYRGDAEEWDSFVYRYGDSTFFHQMGWRKVVENSYGHKALYLAARENGEIKGVLPLFLMEHVLFGRFLISVPFGDYAGICADDEETARALLSEAMNIAKDTGVKFLELRQYKKIANDQLVCKTNRAALILTLETDPELLWNGLRKEMRKHVRKARKSGLEADIGGEGLLNDFYEVFARHMKELGTPVHSLSFFQNVFREFPDSNVIMVRLNGVPVGACIASYFGDTVEVPWAASIGEFFSLRPNNLLFWTALEHACKRGHKYFNFGRSPLNVGTFQFKKQRGAEPVQLYYQYYLNGSKGMPDYTPSTSSRFDVGIWLWKRLPVGLTKVIGPKIIAGIPY